MFQLDVGSGTLTGAWQRTGVAGIDTDEVSTNMAQEKQRGEYIYDNISRTIGQNDLKFAQHLPEGVS